MNSTINPEMYMICAFNNLNNVKILISCHKITIYPSLIKKKIVTNYYFLVIFAIIFKICDSYEFNNKLKQQLLLKCRLLLT